MIPLRISFYFGVFLLFLSPLFAQNEIKIEVRFQVPEFVTELNFNKKAFFAWGKAFKEEIQKVLAPKENEKRDVLLLTTLHKEKDVRIEVSARPAYSKERQQQIIEQLQKISAPHAKMSDFPILFSIQINKGYPKKDLEFSPPLITPLARRKKVFQVASLIEKKRMLQKWTATEVFPVLVYYGTQVEKEFSGTKNLAKKLATLDFSLEIPLAELSEANPDYWQALLEMEPGNQYVPTIKTFLHVAQGEFDIAFRYLSVLKFFANPENLATYYLQDLFWKLEEFLKEFNKEVGKGIKLCGLQKFSESMEHYQDLLAIYPKSALANYEFYFTKRSLHLKKTQESIFSDPQSLSQAKRVVADCDPFYSFNVKASTPKDGYLMYRRVQIQNLFKSKARFKKDFWNYASIALDLEEYAFSAELYWLNYTYILKNKKDKRRALVHFLYCLQKINLASLPKLIEGISAKEIEKIPQERAAIMMQHPIYQSFEKVK